MSNLSNMNVVNNNYIKRKRCHSNSKTNLNNYNHIYNSAVVYNYLNPHNVWKHSQYIYSSSSIYNSTPRIPNSFLSDGFSQKIKISSNESQSLNHKFANKHLPTNSRLSHQNNPHHEPVLSKKMFLNPDNTSVTNSKKLVLRDNKRNFVFPDTIDLCNKKYITTDDSIYTVDLDKYASQVKIHSTISKNSLDDEQNYIHPSESEKCTAGTFSITDRASENVCPKKDDNDAENVMIMSINEKNDSNLMNNSSNITNYHVDHSINYNCANDYNGFIRSIESISYPDDLSEVDYNDEVDYGFSDNTNLIDDINQESVIPSLGLEKLSQSTSNEIGNVENPQEINYSKSVESGLIDQAVKHEDRPVGESRGSEVHDSVNNDPLLKINDFSENNDIKSDNENCLQENDCGLQNDDKETFVQKKKEIEINNQNKVDLYGFKTIFSNLESDKISFKNTTKKNNDSNTPFLDDVNKKIINEGIIELNDVSNTISDSEEICIFPDDDEDNKSFEFHLYDNKNNLCYSNRSAKSLSNYSQIGEIQNYDVFFCGFNNNNRTSVREQDFDGPYSEQNHIVNEQYSGMKRIVKNVSYNFFHRKRRCHLTNYNEYNIRCSDKLSVSYGSSDLNYGMISNGHRDLLELSHLRANGNQVILNGLCCNSYVDQKRNKFVDNNWPSPAIRVTIPPWRCT